MIDKICDNLILKIRKKMPEINDERAEVILYGIKLIIGEFPKIILLFLTAFILKIGFLTFFTFITMLPYKTVAGGFHLKTHIGCFLGTCIIYLGVVLLSKNIIITQMSLKYIVILLTWLISIIMITLYAPADTINLPILRKKERKIKKILSYIFATIILIIAVIIKNNIISNILILNILIESFCISRIAYKLTKNEYGFEKYEKQVNLG